MKDYTWKSSLSRYLQSYISIQRAAGFKFVSPERVLQHFDHYHFYNGYQDATLTKDLLSGFIYGKAEAASTWHHKEIILRGFTVYMKNSGFRTYIPPLQTKVPRSKYIPHIYTKEEINRFFYAVDHYPDTMNSARNAVDPVLFIFSVCTKNSTRTYGNPRKNP